MALPTTDSASNGTAVAPDALSALAEKGVDLDRLAAAFGQMDEGQIGFFKATKNVRTDYKSRRV